MTRSDATDGGPEDGAPDPLAVTSSGALRLEDAERVWSRGTNHLIVQWRNVLLTHWFAAVSEDALSRCEKASFDLASSHAGGLVVFNVIEYGIPLPTTSARKKASAVLGATEAHVLRTATVIRGEGFWASAGRAMIATITLLSKARHPHKVFGDVGAAADWSVQSVSPTTTAERFAHATRRFTDPNLDAS